MSDEEELICRVMPKAPTAKRRNTEDITDLVMAGARFDSGVREIAELKNVSNKGGVPVSKSKVYKARKEVMIELSQRAVPPTNALFLDGKKTETTEAKETADGKKKMVRAKVEHYVVTDAARQEYVGEFVPEGGTGDEIGQSFLDYVDGQAGLNIDDVDILGGDSCFTMTGRWGGVFSYVDCKKVAHFTTWSVWYIFRSCCSIFGYNSLCAYPVIHLVCWITFSFLSAMPNRRKLLYT